MADDPLAWETIDQRVAYTCPGFDVINESVRLPDGTETDFDYVTETPSVCILPFVETDSGQTDASTTVVCIEEWRQAVARINFGLPVGSVESTDEDLVAAAHRELTEETGYEATAISPLTTVEVANGFADTTLHIFVATGCTPTADQQLDFNESIRVTTTTLEQLTDAVAAGDIRDGRTVLAVLQYQLVSGRSECQ